MTTFLVSNGTRPKVIQNLTKPTMLYISIYGPDKPTYLRVARPIEPRNWENLLESLEVLNSFNSNTVLRLTLMNGLNLQNAEGYAKLIERANPTFIEVKGYVYVGFSRARLEFDHMPPFLQIQEFLSQIPRQIYCPHFAKLLQYFAGQNFLSTSPLSAFRLEQSLCWKLLLPQFSTKPHCQTARYTSVGSSSPPPPAAQGSPPLWDCDRILRHQKQRSG